MPVNGRVKGHSAERAAARYLRDAGYPLAITSRNALGHDGTPQSADILGIPGVSIEVKNRQSLNIGAALCQASIQAGPEKLPVVLAKPYGISLENVGAWWSITYFRDLVPLFPGEGAL
jgi:hypothetical protein